MNVLPSPGRLLASRRVSGGICGIGCRSQPQNHQFFKSGQDSCNLIGRGMFFGTMTVFCQWNVAEIRYKSTVIIDVDWGFNDGVLTTAVGVATSLFHGIRMFLGSITIEIR